jgi:hypothetical protein
MLFLSLFFCAKSRLATPQRAVKQRRKPKINVSSLLTSPSFACSLCIRAQRVQSAAWITHQSVSLLARISIFPCVHPRVKSVARRYAFFFLVAIVLIARQLRSTFVTTQSRVRSRHNRVTARSPL